MKWNWVKMKKSFFWFYQYLAYEQGHLTIFFFLGERRLFWVFFFLKKMGLHGPCMCGACAIRIHPVSPCSSCWSGPAEARQHRTAVSFLPLHERCMEDACVSRKAMNQFSFMHCACSANVRGGFGSAVVRARTTIGHHLSNAPKQCLHILS